MPLNDNILDAIKNRKYCLRHVEPDKQAGTIYALIMVIVVITS
jgi:hypothetical protein